MSDQLRITFEPDARPDEIEAVRVGLTAYNMQFAPSDAYHPITLFIRDDQGAIVGGLLGSVGWSWLYVDILWLSESIRAQGYGSRLLAEAERIAMKQGCIAAQLDTMSFQALPFYERHGYSVFGVLDNFPPGHKKYFLQKQLVVRGDP